MALRLVGNATPSGLRIIPQTLIPGLPKRNPGLELANAFGVNVF